MKGKALKVWSIFCNTIIYLFVGIGIIALILTLTAKKDADGTSSIFGYQIRTVLSPSMEKCELTDVSGYKIKDIKTKSVVFIETIPDDYEAAQKFYQNLKVGDVLTFKYVYERQETITHRITEISPKIDDYGNCLGYIIKLEGDNKASDSATLTQVIDSSVPNNQNYVIGKVVGSSYFIGLVIYSLKTTVGLICMIIIPCVLIIIYEIIKIVTVLSSDKKKAKETFDKQQLELETLRKRLEEIEKNQFHEQNN